MIKPSLIKTDIKRNYRKIINKETSNKINKILEVVTDEEVPQT